MPQRPKSVEAVVLDVGETLIDETRVWSAWADRLAIPRLTFMAILGAAIARGEDHHAPTRLLRPDVDIRATMADAATQDGGWIQASDLYPDAVAGLRGLVAAGYRVGVVGNQPARSEAMLRDLGVQIELIASSESLGAAKPDPGFFLAIADRLRLEPSSIAYVGDRVDNDVRPAASVGMRTVFIRRGPWAWIQAGPECPPDADVEIDSLLALPEVLATLD